MSSRIAPVLAVLGLSLVLPVSAGFSAQRSMDLPRGSMELPRDPIVLPRDPIVLPGHERDPRFSGPRREHSPPHRFSKPRQSHSPPHRFSKPRQSHSPPHRFSTRRGEPPLPRRHQFAGRFHRPGIGIYIRHLPHGAERILVGNAIVFVFGDTYYRWHPGYHRYHIIGIGEHSPVMHYVAPGALVDRLPRGAQVIHHRGGKYYRYQQHYFYPIPAQQGLYRVLERLP